MIKRYQNINIEKLWNKENQVKIWLKVEQIVSEYWHREGLFNEKNNNAIQGLKIEENTITEIEQTEAITRHEISAFVKVLSRKLNNEDGKWIHYGLTSNDILDTSQNYLLKKSAQLIIKQLEEILLVLEKKAKAEKYTISLGRTHGMHAEPITVGFKFALWFNELKNHLNRIKAAKQEINYVKILGPTGMGAHGSLNLNKFVAKKLKMEPIKIATQIISRDHLIHFFNTLVNLATSIEKMAIEIRNLSRDEINEIQEGFKTNQEGSSAMPHKKNPIICENICGLVRYLRAGAQSFYNTNLIWHERDLTNSSIERLAIPSTLHLTMTILTRWESVLKSLVIKKDQIEKNLKKINAKVMSHTLLLKLIKETKLNREEAYDLIQGISLQTPIKDLKEKLSSSLVPKYLTVEQLEECFNIKKFTKEINKIFQEVFSKDE